nr:serine hydrolase domain-containing protein [Paenibacillus dendritiformis]
MPPKPRKNSLRLSIIYQRAFGEADLATGRRLTTGSAFDLASLSKPFTAAGIMVLAEEGKLGYEKERKGSPLSNY